MISHILTSKGFIKRSVLIHQIKSELNFKVTSFVNLAQYTATKHFWIDESHVTLICENDFHPI